MTLIVLLFAAGGILILLAVIIAAIQDQQRQIDALAKQIAPELPSSESQTEVIKHPSNPTAEDARRKAQAHRVVQDRKKLW